MRFEIDGHSDERLARKLKSLGVCIMRRLGGHGGGLRERLIEGRVFCRHVERGHRFTPRVVWISQPLSSAPGSASGCIGFSQHQLPCYGHVMHDEVGGSYG